MLYGCGASPSPSPSSEEWICSVCNHVYNAAADGGGKPFESLPESWLCPVCGKPKSAYKKSAPGPSPVDTWTCKVCLHTYDPVRDGGGLAFEKLPSTWTCPVCGNPKSAFEKGQAPPSPSPSPSPASEKWVCTICNHVYDASVDGGGLAFEKLPETWKCPVCGKPKSFYKKSTSSLVDEQTISSNNKTGVTEALV